MEPTVYEYDLLVLYAAADVDFVRGYLLPSLDLSALRVITVDEFELSSTMLFELERTVQGSRFTLGILSPAFLEDRWTKLGAEMARHLGALERNRRFVPLICADCDLPLWITALVSFDYRDPAHWELETARLRGGLSAVEPARVEVTCPYPGMRPYARQDSHVFAGRDGEIRRLVADLERGEREIHVIGPSGAGKTSLIQAGLCPALDDNSRDLARSLCVRALRPGVSPASGLARALEGDLAAPGAVIDRLLESNPPAERVLVIVDQLEELFQLPDADEQRRRFTEAIAGLREDPRCCLLFVLRADSWGTLLGDALLPHSPVQRLEVAPLRGRALVHAITEPALRSGVRAEPRLCDRLVADVSAERGALAPLQEVLRQLWDRRQRQLLRLHDYEALGGDHSGIGVAIARCADATMQALPPGRQAIARRILLRLVAFGEGRPDTRRQQSLQALRSATDDPVAFAEVLRYLTDARVITTDCSGVLDAVVDLSHEALILSWSALQDLVRTRRQDERRRRLLEATVQAWVERGCGEAGLLNPTELAEAEHWMQSDAAGDLGFGIDLPALVAASRAHVESQLIRTRDVMGRGSVKRDGLSRGANHLLAVGIDRYLHHGHLWNCVRDAGDIADILTTTYEFESCDVRTLFDGDATKKHILSALDDYASLNEVDSLVIYFAGHGVSRKGIGSWIPVDAEHFTDYLPLSTVREYLEPIKARHIFAIVDSCFSGRFFSRTRSKDDTRHVEAAPSRYALTAGRDEPVLDGSAGDNSPFADAVKYYLTGSTDSIGAVELSNDVMLDVSSKVDGVQTPRHGELHIRGNRHGQFFFHRRRSTP